MSVNIRSSVSDGAIQYNSADMISVNTGNVNVTSNANLNVAKSAAITGNLTVTGSGAFTGNLTLGGNQVLTSASGGLGYGQTWQNVTGSRAINAPAGPYSNVYTNTTGKPIVVAVNFNYASSFTVALLVSGVTISSNASNSSSPIFYNSVDGIVPPGATYEVRSTISVSSWVELR